jgi:hypothetical protein
MKINFTKKEYKTLLELIYIGDWIVNSNNTEKDITKEKYDEITQKIYSYAKDFGCENLVKYEANYDKYYETREFEDSETHEYIEEYENNSFWESLISRLAERDLMQEISPADLGNIDHEDRITKMHDKEQKWSLEFEKNGIKNLKI